MNVHLRYLKKTRWQRRVLKTLGDKRPVGRDMAAVFESREEEIMRKANKILKTASVACLHLPYELKEYVIEECKNYLGQRSADPSEVCRCLSQAVKNLAELLEQCSDDLSKTFCSGYEDEAL